MPPVEPRRRPHLRLRGGRSPWPFEILEYINHVADRFDLRRDVQLSTRIARAVYDETTARWSITTDRDNAVEARFCIMATGCLSTPQFPPLFPVSKASRDAGTTLGAGHTKAWTSPASASR
jgi:cation diffusion facilitator CzcD-associated flavoprotein CzcO